MIRRLSVKTLAVVLALSQTSEALGASMQGWGASLPLHASISNPPDVFAEQALINAIVRTQRYLLKNPVAPARVVRWYREWLPSSGVARAYWPHMVLGVLALAAHGLGHPWIVDSAATAAMLLPPRPVENHAAPILKILGESESPMTIAQLVAPVSVLSFRNTYPNTLVSVLSFLVHQGFVVREKESHDPETYRLSADAKKDLERILSFFTSIQYERATRQTQFEVMKLRSELGWGLDSSRPPLPAASPRSPAVNIPSVAPRPGARAAAWATDGIGKMSDEAQLEFRITALSHRVDKAREAGHAELLKRFETQQARLQSALESLRRVVPVKPAKEQTGLEILNAYSSFGDMVIDREKQLGYSAEDVAQKTRINLNRYNLIRKGAVLPDLRECYELGHLLGFPPRAAFEKFVQRIPDQPAATAAPVVLQVAPPSEEPVQETVAAVIPEQPSVSPAVAPAVTPVTVPESVRAYSEHKDARVQRTYRSIVDAVVKLLGVNRPVTLETIADVRGGSPDAVYQALHKQHVTVEELVAAAVAGHFDHSNPGVAPAADTTPAVHVDEATPPSEIADLTPVSMVAALIDASETVLGPVENLMGEAADAAQAILPAVLPMPDSVRRALSADSDPRVRRTMNEILAAAETLLAQNKPITYQNLDAVRRKHGAAYQFIHTQKRSTLEDIEQAARSRRQGVHPPQAVAPAREEAPLASPISRLTPSPADFAIHAPTSILAVLDDPRRAESRQKLFVFRNAARKSMRPNGKLDLKKMAELLGISVPNIYATLANLHVPLDDFKDWSFDRDWTKRSVKGEAVVSAVNKREHELLMALALLRAAANPDQSVAAEYAQVLRLQINAYPGWSRSLKLQMVGYLMQRVRTNHGHFLDVETQEDLQRALQGVVRYSKGAVHSSPDWADQLVEALNRSNQEVEISIKVKATPIVKPVVMAEAPAGSVETSVTAPLDAEGRTQVLSRLTELINDRIPRVAADMMMRLDSDRPLAFYVESPAFRSVAGVANREIKQHIVSSAPMASKNATFYRAPKEHEIRKRMTKILVFILQENEEAYTLFAQLYPELRKSLITPVPSVVGRRAPGPAMRWSKKGLTEEIHRKAVNPAIKSYFDQPEKPLPIPFDSETYKTLDPDGILAKHQVSIYGLPRLIQKIGMMALRAKLHQEDIPWDLVDHVGRVREKVYMDADLLENVLGHGLLWRRKWAIHILTHIEHPELDEEAIQKLAPLPDETDDGDEVPVPASPVVIERQVPAEMPIVPPVEVTAPTIGSVDVHADAASDEAMAVALHTLTASQDARVLRSLRKYLTAALALGANHEDITHLALGLATGSKGKSNSSIASKSTEFFRHNKISFALFLETVQKLAASHVPSADISVVADVEPAAQEVVAPAGRALVVEEPSEQAAPDKTFVDGSLEEAIVAAMRTLTPLTNARVLNSLRSYLSAALALHAESKAITHLALGKATGSKGKTDAIIATKSSVWFRDNKVSFDLFLETVAKLAARQVPAADLPIVAAVEEVADIVQSLAASEPDLSPYIPERLLAVMQQPGPAYQTLLAAGRKALAQQESRVLLDPNDYPDIHTLPISWRDFFIWVDIGLLALPSLGRMSGPASDIGTISPQSDPTTSPKTFTLHKSLNYVKSLIGFGKVDQALTMVNDALAQFGSDRRLRALKLKLLIKMNKYEEALVEVQKDLAVNPRDIVFVRLAVMGYVAVNKQLDARKVAQPVLDLDPAHFNLNEQASRAAILWSLGERGDARREVTRILARSPNVEEAKQLLEVMNREEKGEAMEGPGAANMLARPLAWIWNTNPRLVVATVGFSLALNMNASWPWVSFWLGHVLVSIFAAELHNLSTRLSDSAAARSVWTAA